MISVGESVATLEIFFERSTCEQNEITFLDLCASVKEFHLVSTLIFVHFKRWLITYAVGNKKVLYGFG